MSRSHCLSAGLILAAQAGANQATCMRSSTSTFKGLWQTKTHTHRNWLSLYMCVCVCVLLVFNQSANDSGWCRIRFESFRRGQAIGIPFLDHRNHSHGAIAFLLGPGSIRGTGLRLIDLGFNQQQGSQWHAGPARWWESKLWPKIFFGCKCECFFSFLFFF